MIKIDSVDTVDAVGEQTGNEISITQRNGRLKILADVDVEGVAALQVALADFQRRAAEKPKRRHRRTA